MARPARRGCQECGHWLIGLAADTMPRLGLTEEQYQGLHHLAEGRRILATPGGREAISWLLTLPPDAVRRLGLTEEQYQGLHHLAAHFRAMTKRGDRFDFLDGLHWLEPDLGLTRTARSRA